jgi:hypothetical protein
MMRRIDTVLPERDRFEFSDKTVVRGSTYCYQIAVLLK